MDKGQKIAAGLAIGLAGAHLYKWYGVPPSFSPRIDAVKTGLVVGAAISVVWLATSDVPARSNGVTDGAGTLGPEARALLNTVSVAVDNGLYLPRTSGGVKVAPIPAEPSRINQDEV